MDEMTSTEFRRRYPKITEPTRVTVLGRPIGVWIPRDAAEDYARETATKVTAALATEAGRRAATAAREAGMRTAAAVRAGSFGSPRPAPKKRS